MDFLKEWVRSLAMLVLLGATLDLLLPMNSMKKYVRMTVGLVVVLTVCKPLLALLGHPVNLEPSVFADTGSGRLPSVAEIMAEARRFREKNQKLALTEAQSRLTAEAVAAAKAVNGVADAEASVELDTQGGDVRIRQVLVTLFTARAGRLVRPVLPVQPVTPPAKAGSAEPGTTPGAGTGSASGAGSGSSPSAESAAPAGAGSGSDRGATDPASGAVEPATPAELALADAVRREVAARLGIRAESQIIRVLLNGGK